MPLQEARCLQRKGPHMTSLPEPAMLAMRLGLCMLWAVGLRLLLLLLLLRLRLLLPRLRATELVQQIGTELVQRITQEERQTFQREHSEHQMAVTTGPRLSPRRARNISETWTWTHGRALCVPDSPPTRTSISKETHATCSGRLSALSAVHLILLLHKQRKQQGPTVIWHPELPIGVQVRLMRLLPRLFSCGWFFGWFFVLVVMSLTLHESRHKSLR